MAAHAQLKFVMTECLSFYFEDTNSLDGAHIIIAAYEVLVSTEIFQNQPN